MKHELRFAPIKYISLFYGQRQTVRMGRTVWRERGIGAHEREGEGWIECRAGGLCASVRQLIAAK